MLQAAEPSVQREGRLGTSYDTDIWQIDLTSLSPPLLDNALVPRVKCLLNAGTLKMWLASALQSTWRVLICADLSLKEVNAPPVSPASCPQWISGFGDPASAAESCSVVTGQQISSWGMVWRDWSREVLGGRAAVTACSPNHLWKVASFAQELEGRSADSSTVSPWCWHTTCGWWLLFPSPSATLFSCFGVSSVQRDHFITGTSLSRSHVKDTLQSDFTFFPAQKWQWEGCSVGMTVLGALYLVSRSSSLCGACGTQPRWWFLVCLAGESAHWGGQSPFASPAHHRQKEQQCKLY